MSYNVLDIAFTAATTGASLFSFFMFQRDTTSPKGPVPIHFGWWGEADQTVKNTTVGAAIYPLLTAVIAGSRFLVPRKGFAAAEGARIRNEADAQSCGPVVRFLRIQVMPRLNRTFFLRTATLLILYLQNEAHEISYGKKDSVSVWVVRPIVIMFAAVIGAHAALGTSALIAA